MGALGWALCGLLGEGVPSVLSAQRGVYGLVGWLVCWFVGGVAAHQGSVAPANPHTLPPGRPASCILITQSSKAGRAHARPHVGWSRQSSKQVCWLSHIVTGRGGGRERDIGEDAKVSLVGTGEDPQAPAPHQHPPRSPWRRRVGSRRKRPVRQDPLTAHRSTGAPAHASPSCC